VSKQDPDAESRDAPEEPFLQRWSRLKSATRDPADPAGSQGDATPPAPAAEGQPASPPPAEGTGPTAPALPDLESLGPDSDYSAFLGPDVDLSMRRAALRKLFRSPKFNVLDGLDDYCDDFTQFAPLAGIVTADMRHHVERAARELVAAEDSKQPSPPTDHEPKPRLPNAAAEDAATRAAADDGTEASGTVSGDTADPATEEPEKDADRRPA